MLHIDFEKTSAALHQLRDEKQHHSQLSSRYASVQLELQEAQAKAASCHHELRSAREELQASRGIIMSLEKEAKVLVDERNEQQQACRLAKDDAAAKAQQLEQEVLSFKNQITELSLELKTLKVLLLLNFTQLGACTPVLTVDHCQGPQSTISSRRQPK